MDTTRAWAEIDLDALASNLATIRRVAGPGVRIMLVVKADAYGHGAVAVAHHAGRNGIGALGVGTSGEALDLRECGIRLPILVLGTVAEEELAACLRHGIHIGLHSSDRRVALQALARALDVRARVHMNVDTGMGRLGVLPSHAIRLLQEIRGASHLELAGVMTHISSPDGARDPHTAEQLASFDDVLSRARELDLVRGWIHAASSAAIFTGLGPRYDTVRPGIAAYGGLPTDLGDGTLRPVMSIRSRVVFLKDVPAGSPVGYGSTWRARRPTRIATLPIGYGNGLPWRLAGTGQVSISGRRAPIVGRLSMDYTTVDVGGLPGVQVGDIATVMGQDGDEELSVGEIAGRAGTIPYEITCSAGRGLARVFVGGDVLVPGQAPAGMDRVRMTPVAREGGRSGQPADR